MDRYLKRSDHSQEIWATQLTPENVQDLVQRTRGHVVNEFDMITNEKMPAINLRTYRGMKRLSQKGWLIQYVSHKPSIFEVMPPEQFDVEYELAEVKDESTEGPSDNPPVDIRDWKAESDWASDGQWDPSRRFRI